MERVFGPVITAVDEGHVQHGKNCVKCAIEWPCMVIVAARAWQPKYGERLRQERAILAGQLSSLAVR